MPRVGGKAGPEGVKAGKLPLPRPVAALVGASPIPRLDSTTEPTQLTEV